MPALSLNRARLRTVISATALISVALTMQSCTPAVQVEDIPQVSVPVASTSDLLDSIGINVHETYNDTTYAPDNDVRALTRSLSGLGIKWIRIGLKISPPAYERDFMDGLRRAGIKVLAVIGGPNDSAGGFAQGQSSLLIKTLGNSVYRGRIDAVELPNELDASGVPSWPADLTAYDREYYTALKADPATKNLTIVGPAMSQPFNYQRIPSVTEYQDARNIHPYAADGWPESPFLQGWKQSSLGGATPSGQPVYATEFGYHNAVNLPNGVSETDSAIYIPRAFLWNYFHGVTRSFSYELFDESPDPDSVNTEDHYGLVAVTGAPGMPSTWRQRVKPSYIALRNLITALRSKSMNTISRVLVDRRSRGVEIVKLRRPDGGTFYLAWRTGRIDSVKERVIFKTPGQRGAKMTITDLATSRTTTRVLDGDTRSVMIGSSAQKIELSVPR